MEITTKERRNLLNKAWEIGIRRYSAYWRSYRTRADLRDRDVSKILKEVETKQRKGGSDGF